MISVTNFLSKFLKLEKDNKLKQSLVLDIINKVAKVSLNKEMLQMGDEQLKIVCSPIFRNEVFMHKKEIEDSLKSQNIYLNIV